MTHAQAYRRAWAIRRVFREHADGLDAVNVLGICQGGTFSIVYSALFPEKIKNLILMINLLPANYDDRRRRGFRGHSWGG
jgi:hypothetical protein